MLTHAVWSGCGGVAKAGTIPFTEFYHLHVYTIRIPNVARVSKMWRRCEREGFLRSTSLGTLHDDLCHHIPSLIGRTLRLPPHTYSSTSFQDDTHPSMDVQGAGKRRERSKPHRKDERASTNASSTDRTAAAPGQAKPVPISAAELRKARLAYLYRLLEERRTLLDQAKQALKDADKQKAGASKPRTSKGGHRVRHHRRRVPHAEAFGVKKGSKARKNEEGVFVYGPPPATAGSDALASRYHGALDTGVVSKSRPKPTPPSPSGKTSTRGQKESSRRSAEPVDKTAKDNGHTSDGSTSSSTRASHEANRSSGISRYAAHVQSRGDPPRQQTSSPAERGPLPSSRPQLYRSSTTPTTHSHSPQKTPKASQKTDKSRPRASRTQSTPKSGSSAANSPSINSPGSVTSKATSKSPSQKRSSGIFSLLFKPKMVAQV